MLKVNLTPHNIPNSNVHTEIIPDHKFEKPQKIVSNTSTSPGLVITADDPTFLDSRTVSNSDPGVRSKENENISTANTHSSNTNASKYSADLEPVQLRMNKSHILHFNHLSTANNSNYQPSRLNNGRDFEPHSSVKQHLHRTNNLNTGINIPMANEFFPFNSIDTQQYEKYLTEPHHIKMFRKRKSLKHFRGLFLAQELKAYDEDLIEASSSTNGNNSYSPLTATIDGNLERNNHNVSSANSNISIVSPNTDGRSHITDDATLSSISDLNHNDNENPPTLTSPSESCIFSSSNKSPEMNCRAIWTLAFSTDGKYMATGSKDSKIRIWKVISSPVERGQVDSTIKSAKEVETKTNSLRAKIHTNSPGTRRKESKNPSMESLEENEKVQNLYAPVFHPSIFKTYNEHEHDVLSLDWSKNGFLISASMDKSVKLWHPEQKKSLKTFLHPDFVTSVKFHPTDDRFFISGCLDHKCRLWSILEGTVCFVYDCKDLITSVIMSPNEGKYTIIGTFNGYIHILATKGLDPLSSFHVSSRRTQEEKVKPINPDTDIKLRHGPRITELQCFKSSIDYTLRLLVSSNDSKIRIFELGDKKLLEVMKGFHSGSSQHRAQLLTWGDQPAVISSSYDHWVYIWKLKSSTVPPKPDEKETSKNLSRQLNLKKLIINPIIKTLSGTAEEKEHNQHRSHFNLKKILAIPHHRGADQPIKNSEYACFLAHNAPVTTVAVAPKETAKTLSLSNDFICELSLEFFQPSDLLSPLQRKNSEEYDDPNSVLSDGDSTMTSFTTPTSFVAGSSTARSDSNTSNGMLGSPPAPTSTLSAVDAIGTILVTTDSLGTIRIFRSDMPPQMRRRVLQKLQEYNHELKGRASNINGGLFESPTNLPTHNEQP